MLTISDSEQGVSLSVDVDRWDADSSAHGRWQYRYVVTIGHVTIEGTDLRSGTVSTDTAPDLPDMLRGLCSFLSADAETYQADMGPTDGDGYLFGEIGAEAAYMAADVIDVLASLLGGAQ